MLTDQVLTEGDVCQILNVSRTRVQHLRFKGALAAQRTPTGRWFYFRSNVDQYLAARDARIAAQAKRAEATPA